MKERCESEDKEDQQGQKQLDRVARREVADEIATSLRQIEEALKKDAST